MKWYTARVADDGTVITPPRQVFSYTEAHEQQVADVSTQPAFSGGKRPRLVILTDLDTGELTRDQIIDLHDMHPTIHSLMHVAYQSGREAERQRLL